MYNGFSNALKDGGRACACVNEFANLVQSKAFSKTYNSDGRGFVTHEPIDASGWTSYATLQLLVRDDTVNVLLFQERKLRLL